MPLIFGKEKSDKELREETRKLDKELKRIDRMTVEEAEKEFPHLLPNGKRKK